MLPLWERLPAFVADPADPAGATVATGAAMAESAATSAEQAPATIPSRQPAFAEGYGAHEMPLPQKNIKLH
jgi:hypothetical protein